MTTFDLDVESGLNWKRWKEFKHTQAETDLKYIVRDIPYFNVIAVEMTRGDMIG